MLFIVFLSQLAVKRQVFLAGLPPKVKTLDTAPAKPDSYVRV